MVLLSDYKHTVSALVLVQTAAVSLRGELLSSSAPAGHPQGCWARFSEEQHEVICKSHDMKMVLERGRNESTG